MNYYKLIQLIKTKPELWDRCNSSFREPQVKEEIWNDVGREMKETSTACKDGFKHLREKYLREREKSKILKDKYNPWELLTHLTFLDGQIIPRKNQQFPLILNKQENGSDRFPQATQFCNTDNNDNTHNPSDAKFVCDQSFLLEHTKNVAQSEFDELLVETVKNTRALWDWKNSKFWNKHSRNRTWEIIAQQLNKTPTECFTRWKALREKYIREKMKQRENKWELLDSMSFLDNVIQYRKSTRNLTNTSETNFQDQSTKSQKFDQDFSPDNVDFLFSGESSMSNADYHYRVIGEENSFSEPMMEFPIEIKQEYKDVPDSSYDSEDSSRKRRSSVHSCCSEKRQKEDKRPEELFGELVASLLMRKNEGDRQTTMIEIMKVLAKQE